MGTEFYFNSLFCSFFVRLIVKLNNPLMGTETYLNQFEPIALQDDTVKLNNPQMGTETRVNQQFWLTLPKIEC